MPHSGTDLGDPSERLRHSRGDVRAAGATAGRWQIRRW